MKDLIVSSLVADRPFRQRPQAQGSTEGAEGRPAKVGFMQPSMRMVLTLCQTRRMEDATVKLHPPSRSPGEKLSRKPPASVKASPSVKPSTLSKQPTLVKQSTLARPSMSSRPSPWSKPSPSAAASNGVPPARGVISAPEESFLHNFSRRLPGRGPATSSSNVAGSSKSGAI